MPIRVISIVTGSGSTLGYMTLGGVVQWSVYCMRQKCRSTLRGWPKHQQKLQQSQQRTVSHSWRDDGMRPARSISRALANGQRSMDRRVVPETSDSSSRSTVAMKDPQSEAPMLPAGSHRGETARSRQLCCVLVLFLHERSHGNLQGRPQNPIGFVRRTPQKSGGSLGEGVTMLRSRL